MSKAKTKIKDLIEEPETVEEMPFVPPEIHELAEQYIVSLPVSDPYFTKSRWEQRLHIERVLEHRLGDTVQLTSIKVRKPHLISKSVARIRRREPCVRAYVTIKF